MPVGALITAGATIGGALLSGSAQKKAAGKAADTAAQNTQQNNALTREIYGQNSANLQPFMQSGVAAGGQLNSLLGGDSSAFDKFRQSTNYDFRLGEGMKALNQGYAARGLLESGAAMKGITRYGQDFASNELGNYMDLLGRQQNVGLSGANALAGVGTNMVNAVTNNNNSAASAAANAALINGNAQGQMYGQIGNALGQFAGSIGSSYGRAPEPKWVPPINPYVISM
jgi:hypothetical protein